MWSTSERLQTIRCIKALYKYSSFPFLSFQDGHNHHAVDWTAGDHKYIDLRWTFTMQATLLYDLSFSAKRKDSKCGHVAITKFYCLIIHDCIGDYTFTRRSSEFLWPFILYFFLYFCATIWWNKVIYIFKLQARRNRQTDADNKQQTQAHNLWLFLFKILWSCVHYVHCRHVRLSYVINFYLLTYLQGRIIILYEQNWHTAVEDKVV